MEYFLVLAVNYLLGSTPAAYIVGKLKGIDITQHGSGNVGATNAFRILGKGAGLVVLVFDCLKGVIGVLLAQHLVGDPWFVILAALVVVTGHNYSLFLKFKGGKGVATGAGIFLVLAPKTVLTAFIVFVIVVAVSKYVSLGSLITAATFPIIMTVIGEPFPVRVLGIVVALFVIYRHIPNIKRLVAGKENKITDRMH